MKNFSAKVVVITGAGSGMGRAYALEFARLGAKLALNDFDAQSLAETASLLADSNAAGLYTQAFDVADRPAMQAFADAVRQQLGPAHLVINNAGIGGSGLAVAELDVAEFDRIMQINFNGVVNGCTAFLPQLQENQQAAIVNISSIFGLVGMPRNSAYCAAKFAVRGFTESLMVELQDSPISVHLVHPGGIRTNIAAGSEDGEAFAEKFLTTAPEDVVRQVIAGLRSGKQRIVYGNQSWRVWLLSWLLPLEWRNKILAKEMAKLDAPEQPSAKALD